MTTIPSVDRIATGTNAVAVSGSDIVELANDGRVLHSFSLPMTDLRIATGANSIIALAGQPTSQSGVVDVMAIRTSGETLWSYRITAGDNLAPAAIAAAFDGSVTVVAQQDSAQTYVVRFSP